MSTTAYTATIGCCHPMPMPNPTSTWKPIQTADGMDGLSSVSKPPPIDHGQRPLARLDGTNALDGLEPYQQVVDEDEETSTQTKLVECTGLDGSDAKHARRHCGVVLRPALHGNKGQDEDAEQDEQRNHSAVKDFAQLYDGPDGLL
ncbi:hypothetical protein ISF_02924 [Cordyceps fumosorosea ARSEF 2679]|uniref:Uncharacterized protein n=1 Tax=Cordyceps fumosorosea (strain ARSEF 2679) TaxID=1081104 RepID=A0A162LEV5_CORFA|nr:hypothetical protein ISF_02924 [Cordyceps fumosorosea ARSEF 2679]OAA69654.1 hypothetical protein ISF_02924 [Cordyceps fumosorosea ARSEF 2679]